MQSNQRHPSEVRLGRLLRFGVSFGFVVKSSVLPFSQPIITVRTTLGSETWHSRDAAGPRSFARCRFFPYYELVPEYAGLVQESEIVGWQ